MFIAPDLTAKELIAEDPAWAQRLLGRYGIQAKAMLDSAPASEHQRIPGTDFCLAECRWAARNEAVLHLDDLLLRRTRLGMVMVHGGSELFPALEAICAAELGWSGDHWRHEAKRYLDIWQRFYSLPESN